MKHIFLRWLKHGIQIAIDSGGNPVTLVILVSKRQLYSYLDRLIPDDNQDITVVVSQKEEPQYVAEHLSLRKDK